MKYCTKCGTANDDNAMYCKQCGSPLPAASQNIPPQQQFVPPPPPPPQQPYTPPPAPQAPATPPPPYPYQQGYQQPPFGSPQSMQYSEFQSANTMILIAFIFSIISILVFVVEAIMAVSSILYWSSYIASLPTYDRSLYAGTLNGAYVGLIIYLVFAVFTILVFLKTWKIYNLTQHGRYQEAYQEDTVLWAVLGIIFGLILTGVFLLLARTHLENALRPPRPY
ncbi:MAG: zinc ribbon domain-containing protein [Thermoplasmata archaeon]